MAPATSFLRPTAALLATALLLAFPLASGYGDVWSPERKLATSRGPPINAGHAYVGWHLDPGFRPEWEQERQCWRVDARGSLDTDSSQCWRDEEPTDEGIPPSRAVWGELVVGVILFGAPVCVATIDLEFPYAHPCCSHDDFRDPLLCDIGARPRALP